MPLGPNPNYLAKYNSFVLPGYVQEENFDSMMNIASHPSAYADGSNSEMVGLENKVLSLKLKVWEQDYLTCKNQIQQASTILRSKRNGYADLYVQYTDRHYQAFTQSIKVGKVAGSSVRTLDYEADFSCRPWLVSDTTFTISGSGLNRSRVTIDTDQVGRTIDDGGYTYTTIKLSGQDITVSGYTNTNPFTGFISVSGIVSNLIVNAEAYTAEISSVNANGKMRWADYRTFVGPEKTYFTISGANICEISYNDRWYI